MKFVKFLFNVVSTNGFFVDWQKKFPKSARFGKFVSRREISIRTFFFWFSFNVEIDREIRNKNKQRIWEFFVFVQKNESTFDVDFDFRFLQDAQTKIFFFSVNERKK